MSENPDNLEGWMSRLSDHELVQIITDDSGKFDQREIVFAQEELRIRGFQLEQHDSDLRIMPPVDTESTRHKTVIAGESVSSIIRGVVIVWLITGVGGFFVGVVRNVFQLSPAQGMFVLAAANFLFGTIAFTIVGYLAPPGRWRHLGFVALGVWFSSLINVLFFGFSIFQWIAGAIFSVVIMGMGGAISYIFKGDAEPSV
jgi:hypothetical protein